MARQLCMAGSVGQLWTEEAVMLSTILTLIYLTIVHKCVRTVSTVMPEPDHSSAGPDTCRAAGLHNPPADNQTHVELLFAGRA